MSSDVLTVGSALRRAEIAGHLAEVLVEGHWLLGRVERVEGDGAVLDCEGDELVLRLTSVSAVRIRKTASASAPSRASTPMPAAPQAAPTAAPTPAPAPAVARDAGLVSAGTALDAVLASRHRA